jgi:thymidylate kinase
MNNHPTLIMIRGLPGSGKSYLTAALQTALGAENVVILDPDATDYKSAEYLEHSKTLSEQGVDTKFHPYRYVRAKAHKGIDDHKILIWNQPFMDLDGFNKTVTNLTTYASEHDIRLPLLVVEVEVPAHTAKERIDARKSQGGHGPSEDTFAGFVGRYASFADKGHDVVTVNGHGDVAVSVAAVQKALQSL